MKIWLLMILLLTPKLWGSESMMTLLWDRSPIPVSVKVGTEREVHFTRQNLKVFVPQRIRGKTRVTLQNGVLFIYVFEPFKTERLKVKDLEQNIIFLLDVQGVPQGHSHPISVQESKSIQSKAQTLDKPTDYRVELIRYALQNLTGLPRLQEPLAKVQTRGVNKTLDVIRDKSLQERPIAAFGAGPYRVDIIELKNLKPVARDIHLVNDIQGRWVSRSITHKRLQPKGQSDKSLLLLVSKTY